MTAGDYSEGALTVCISGCLLIDTGGIGGSCNLAVGDGLGRGAPRIFVDG